MKKYLLPQGGSFYKANLHCHSTFSDGRLPPEEMKRKYMEHGYSIIAFSDHNVFIPHNDLTDDNFLALNAYEIDVWQNEYQGFHMNLIALEPDTDKQAYFLPEYSSAHQNEDGIVAQVKSVSHPYEFIRRHLYTPWYINRMIKEGKENGFYTIYNHPAWSCESYQDYIAYEGFDAMEIVNSSCCEGGWDDYNERVYDDLLRADKRMFCVASDDSHYYHPEDKVHGDKFDGYTMIKADRLEYRTVTKALQDGHFYASTGAHLNDLWVDDGHVYVTFDTDIRRVAYSTARIWALSDYADQHPEGFTSACFKLDERDVYFRLTLTDSLGRCAYTNAYFIKELLD